MEREEEKGRGKESKEVEGREEEVSEGIPKRKEEGKRRERKMKGE